MVNFEMKSHYGYEDLLKVIHILRSPEGCPWDKVQTHQSIRRDFLEETYEAVEAIDLDNVAMLREELGDVLLQVAFHADIEADAGHFTMEDVCDEVTKKMIYRHPHVFGSVEANTTEEVLGNWEELKRKEKHQETAASTLDAVARTLPQLWRAEKVMKKAAKAGFEWPNIQGALDKLDEEVGELHQAIEENSNIAEELGDVLFAAVKVARFTGVDPEVALNDTCEKFIRRFQKMEEAAKAGGHELKELSLDEMTTLWNEAKHS